MSNFRTHHIKIDQNYADAILMGDKTFEIRKNDRGYQKGDYVTFDVMDGVLHNYNHGLSDKEFQITYVMSGYGLENGFVVFGIKENMNDK